jgi:two-component system, LytTR family, sensor kinase
MEITANRARSFSWGWIALLWAGLGVFDATQNIFSMLHAGMHHSWAKLFIVLMFNWLPWGLVTPLVIGLGRRYPFTYRSARTWLMHLSAVVAIDVAAAAWASLLAVVVQPWLPDFEASQFMVIWPQNISGGLLPACILYTVILTVTYLLDSKAKVAAQQTDAARLNEQLSHAQLSALQRQIEPHFIFNSLNSIAGLVREQNNDAAVSMIVALSDFLRRVAVSSSEPKARLAQEVEFLQKYMQIQEARFAGRLNLELDIPAQLRNAQVPSLILQPLVENAIKHGIAKRVHGGMVRVTASRTEAMLRLSVYNDGPLLRESNAAENGIGLLNLRTRLELLYGKDSGVRMENSAGSGVEVTVTFPYSEA